MYIKQAPKWLLSFLLCVPVFALSAEKPAANATATAAQQLPTANQQKTNKTKAKSHTTAKYPKRGMSMKQVRKQYGKPKSTRKSKGKVKKQWPRITVWNYGRYSVYFERHIVLHTVVH